MQAAFIEKYGKTDVLQVGERPMPTPSPDQVLIKVKAASINPRDWLLMRGLYPFKKWAEPFPIILCSDISGEIVEVGDGVTNFKVGDHVFGLQPPKDKFGGAAEYVAIKASAIALKPTELSHADAAAIPCAGLTSFQALRDLANAQPGNHILINGASGGVGSYAVQIAKNLGATVTAVAGPDNQQLCQNLGADHTIDYRKENYEKGEPDQYDVVYDVIGRSSPKRCRHVLKRGGCYISTIPSPAVALQVFLSRILAPLGFMKGQKAHMILVKANSADLTEMSNAIASGQIRSLIDSRFSLTDAHKAFEKSQSWRAKGKIVIDVTE
jgi:NADPH:quinone reductase-like Zn-dependent oxidoreductase